MLNRVSALHGVAGLGYLPPWGRVNFHIPLPHFSEEMKPKCRVCLSEHWLSEPHVFKGEIPKPSELCVSASNKGIASNHASNTGVHRPEVRGLVESVKPVDGKGAEGRPPDTAGDSKDGARVKQRWPREAYNAYHREYMRKRRQAMSGAKQAMTPPYKKARS